MSGQWGGDQRVAILVPIHDFQARLSHYLAEAGRGEIVEVTSHGRVIARMVGVPEDADEDLAALIAEGVIDWSGGKPTFAGAPLPNDGPPVSDIVIAGRG